MPLVKSEGTESEVRRRMLTDAEDHDIAPDDDGLTTVRSKVSTMSCACQSRKESRSAPPRHRQVH